MADVHIAEIPKPVHYSVARYSCLHPPSQMSPVVILPMNRTKFPGGAAAVPHVAPWFMGPVARGGGSRRRGTSSFPAGATRDPIAWQSNANYWDDPPSNLVKTLTKSNYFPLAWEQQKTLQTWERSAPPVPQRSMGTPRELWVWGRGGSMYRDGKDPIKFDLGTDQRSR